MVSLFGTTTNLYECPVVYDCLDVPLKLSNSQGGCQRIILSTLSLR